MREIDTFADAIARPLMFDPALAARLRDEVVVHLEESAEHDSAGAAIARFGDGAELVRDVASQAIARISKRFGIATAIGIAFVLAVMEARTSALAQSGDSMFAAPAGLERLLARLDVATFLAAVAFGIVAMVTRRHPSAMMCALAASAISLCSSAFADATLALLHLHAGVRSGLPLHGPAAINDVLILAIIGELGAAIVIALAAIVLSTRAIAASRAHHHLIV